MRAHFVERVYAYQRWREFLASNPAPRDMVQFHAQNKLSLMAHSRPHYQALGRMVARCGDGLGEDFLDAYGDLFMAGLKVRTTRKKHANVLSHLQGYLKRHLGKSDKAALTACIDEYRQGLVPLTVPLDLLRGHFRRLPVSLRGSADLPESLPRRPDAAAARLITETTRGRSSSPRRPPTRRCRRFHRWL